MDKCYFLTDGNRVWKASPSDPREASQRWSGTQRDASVETYW